MVQFHDPLEAIRTLLGNPAHAQDIVYKPKKVFSDETKEKRIYSEMWTGKWWHSIQVSLSSRRLLMLLFLNCLLVCSS